MGDVIDIEDADALRGYLADSGRIDRDESVGVEVISAGVSNRTVRVEREYGERWILKQSLQRLRVPDEWRSPRRRIFREAAGLRWLSEVLPEGAVPDFVFEDRRQYLFAMTEVSRPHENWKEVLMAGRFEPKELLERAGQAAVLLAAVHRRGRSSAQASEGDEPASTTRNSRPEEETNVNSSRHEAAGRIPVLFFDRTAVETLRLDPYYRTTAERVPEAADFLEELADSTGELRQTVVHGDFSPKNLLVRPDRLVLLDHEVIHVGDPGLDVGFFLTHLLSKAHHLRERRDDFLRAVHRFWRRYVEELGGQRFEAPDAVTGEARSREENEAPSGNTDDSERSWPHLGERSVQHLAGCLLARAAGKSVLEYLDEETRSRQVDSVLALQPDLPTPVPAFADAFIDEIHRRSTSKK